MKKLLFIASILFAEEVNVAKKYPLIYKAMQTKQGANNLVGITEANYESKTKDMKENIFMQPPKNIIFFNDFYPWTPFFVFKFFNHYIAFLQKKNIFIYLFILFAPLKIDNNHNNPQHECCIGCLRFIGIVISLFHHLVMNFIISYYNVKPVKTKQELFDMLNENKKKDIAIAATWTEILIIAKVFIALNCGRSR